MRKEKKYMRRIIADGFALSLKYILYIAAYWAAVTLIFFLMTAPFSAAVNKLSGASDISADAAKNPDLKAYFMIDILPDLGGRISSGLNPAVIVSGCLLAFAVGLFFTGGLLESFKKYLLMDSKTKTRSKNHDTRHSVSFLQGGWNNFLTMLLFFLFGGTCFLLLNWFISSNGRFLKTIVWDITENEAAAYFTGLAVRIIYYALFLYLALILQYGRIAAVFGKEPAKGVRMRSVVKFKDGLLQGYDFYSNNKLKAAGLFLIILAMTAVWFILDHLVFFMLTENGGFDPLLWSAFTGLGYIFFRIFQYTAATVFFKLRLK